MSGPALAVMAKSPVPGKVKTRLQPGLSAAQCTSLYKAFILDTINMAFSVPGFTCFLAFTPRNAGREFKNISTSNMELIAQTGRDLGQKMFNLMNCLEGRGYSPLVIIGSDIPSLQPGAISRAARELETHDLCLGPSSDGGYYLIGAKHADKGIFQRVPWSTEAVLKTTIRNAEAAGLSVSLLEQYLDIDTYVDLCKLGYAIRQLRATPGATIPVHTEEWLKKNEI